MAFKLLNNPETIDTFPEVIRRRERVCWSGLDNDNADTNRFIRQIAALPKDWFRSDTTPFDMEGYSRWVSERSPLFFGFTSGSDLEAAVHYSANPDGQSIDTGLVICRGLIHVPDAVSALLELAKFHAEETPGALEYNVLGIGRSREQATDFIVNAAGSQLHPVGGNVEEAYHLLGAA